MSDRWDGSAAAWRRDDGADAMREWRWRSYTDHLQDMGYELDGGDLGPDEPVVASERSEGDRPASSLTAG